MEPDLVRCVDLINVAHSGTAFKEENGVQQNLSFCVNQNANMVFVEGHEARAVPSKAAIIQSYNCKAFAIAIKIFFLKPTFFLFKNL